MRTRHSIASALSDWRWSLQCHVPETDPSRAATLAHIDALLAASPKDIELVEFVDLLEVIGATYGPSSLAWATGRSTVLPFGHRFGGAILGCCRSLGTALHWACRYFPLFQDDSVLRLDIGEDYSTLSYKISDPKVWPRHEDAMYKLGVYAGMIKAGQPDAWSRVQVIVEAEAGQVGIDLEGITRTQVLYGGQANAIRFPTAIVDAPLNLVPRRGPVILKQLSAELTELERSTPIAQRIRHSIYNTMSDGSISQARIARDLGVSSRTLRRRLSAENQSFRLLLDECRMQFAAFEFRTRSRSSLSELALKLGYSEHSTFSRAFLRWAGMAPKEYRRAVMTSGTGSHRVTRASASAQ